MKGNDYRLLDTFIRKYTAGCIDDTVAPDEAEEQVPKLLDAVAFEAEQQRQRWRELSLYVGDYHKEIVALAARHDNRSCFIARALRERHADLSVLSEQILTEIVAEYMQVLRERMKMLRNRDTAAPARIVQGRVPETIHRFFRQLRQENRHHPFSEYALRGKVYLNPEKVRSECFAAICGDFDRLAVRLGRSLGLPALAGALPAHRLIEDRGLAFKHLLQRLLHRSCVMVAESSPGYAGSGEQGPLFYKLAGAFEHYHRGIVAEASLVAHLLSTMALDRLKRRARCAGVLLNKHGTLLHKTYNTCLSAFRNEEAKRLSMQYNLHLHGFGNALLDDEVRAVFERYGEWN